MSEQQEGYLRACRSEYAAASAAASAPASAAASAATSTAEKPEKEPEGDSIDTGEEVPEFFAAMTGDDVEEFFENCARNCARKARKVLPPFKKWSTEEEVVYMFPKRPEGPGQDSISSLFRPAVAEKEPAREPPEEDSIAASMAASAAATEDSGVRPHYKHVSTEAIWKKEKRKRSFLFFVSPQV